MERYQLLARLRRLSKPALAKIEAASNDATVNPQLNHAPAVLLLVMAQMNEDLENLILLADVSVDNNTRSGSW